MKFTVKSKEFRDALKRVSKILPAKNVISVLGTVLIEAEEGGHVVTLTACNMEIEAKTSVSAEIDVGGAICATARALDKAFSLDLGAVTFELGEHLLALRSDKARFDLEVIAAEDFPRISFGDFNLHEIDSTVLSDALRFCALAASDCEIKYYLNGVHIEPRDDCLILEATNGHLLHRSRLARHEGLTSIILPNDGVESALTALGGSENARIGTTERAWRIEGAELCVTGKVVDGSFPDCDRLIPSDVKRLFFGDARKIEKIVKPLAGLKGAALRVEADETETKIALDRTTEYTSIRDAEFDLSVETRGAGALKLNSRYLQTTLSGFGEGELDFGIAETNFNMMLISDRQTSGTHERQALLAGMLW